jgi:hypothetical protein
VNSSFCYIYSFKKEAVRNLNSEKLMKTSRDGRVVVTSQKILAAIKRWKRQGIDFSLKISGVNLAFFTP